MPSVATSPRLTLAAGRAPEAREGLNLLAVRTRDAAWRAEATVRTGDVALVVRIDDAHWIAVERHGHTVTARAVVGPFDQRLASVADVPPEHPLAIRAVDTSNRLRLYNGPGRLEVGLVEDGRFRVLAEVDGRYLSTEVAGGFTGRVVGVEALGSDAVLTRFSYTAVAPEH